MVHLRSDARFLGKSEPRSTGWRQQPVLLTLSPHRYRDGDAEFMTNSLSSPVVARNLPSLEPGADRVRPDPYVSGRMTEALTFCAD